MNIEDEGVDNLGGLRPGLTLAGQAVATLNITNSSNYIAIYS